VADDELLPVGYRFVNTALNTGRVHVIVGYHQGHYVTENPDGYRTIVPHSMLVRTTRPAGQTEIADPT